MEQTQINNKRELFNFNLIQSKNRISLPVPNSLLIQKAHKESIDKCQNSP